MPIPIQDSLCFLKTDPPLIEIFKQSKVDSHSSTVVLYDASPRRSFGGSCGTSRLGLNPCRLKIKTAKILMVKKGNLPGGPS
jgi:hypothetical protein